MSPAPSHPDPANDASPAPASQRDEDAQYYRQVLHELVEIGARLARAIDRQAAPEFNAAPSAAPAASPAPAPAPELTLAFERLARTLRRTIALARTLTAPAQPSRGLSNPGQHNPGPGTHTPSLRRPRAPAPAPAPQHPDPAPRPRQGDAGPVSFRDG